MFDELMNFAQSDKYTDLMMRPDMVTRAKSPTGWEHFGTQAFNKQSEEQLIHFGNSMTGNPEWFMEMKKNGVQAFGWTRIQGKAFVMRILTTAVTVLVFISIPAKVNAGLDSLNPMYLFVPKDATNYTTKLAATVQDRPECQKYKDEIMSYAKGSPTDGKTIGPIVAAKQKASAAGCAK